MRWRTVWIDNLLVRRVGWLTGGQIAKLKRLGYAVYVGLESLYH